MPSRYCASCGRLNPPHRAVCAYCSEPLGPPSARPSRRPEVRTPPSVQTTSPPPDPPGAPRSPPPAVELPRRLGQITVWPSEPAPAASLAAPSGAPSEPPPVSRPEAPDPVATPAPPLGAAWPTLPRADSGGAVPLAPQPGAPPAQDFLTLPRRRRRTSSVVVAVVVVAVVVVAAVAFVVVRSSLRSAPTVYGTPISYSQAEAMVGAALASRSGGPWSVHAFLGLGVGESVGGAGGVATGCSTGWTNSSYNVAPATPGNASPGKVSTWLVISDDPGRTALLTLVSDLGPQVTASNLVEVTGCLNVYLAGPTLACSIVDSTVVAAATDSGGGQTFLTNHPGASQTFLLTDGFWLVAYSTCDPYAATGTGSATSYEAEFNATSGAVISPGTVASTAC